MNEKNHGTSRCASRARTSSSSRLRTPPPSKSSSSIPPVPAAAATCFLHATTALNARKHATQPQNTTLLRSTSAKIFLFRNDAMDANAADTDGSPPSLPPNKPSRVPSPDVSTSTAMGAAASREVPAPPLAPLAPASPPPDPPRLLNPRPSLSPPATTASSPGSRAEKMASSLRAAWHRSLDASLTGAAADGDGRVACVDAPGCPPPPLDDVSESPVSGMFPRASARSAAAASPAPPGAEGGLRVARDVLHRLAQRIYPQLAVLLEDNLSAGARLGQEPGGRVRDLCGCGGERVGDAPPHGGARERGLREPAGCDGAAVDLVGHRAPRGGGASLDCRGGRAEFIS